MDPLIFWNTQGKNVPRPIITTEEQTFEINKMIIAPLGQLLFYELLINVPKTSV